jgi:hypothetical protein
MRYGETGLRITSSNPRYSVCHCPLPGHSDTHASSVIYHDSNMFVCFRCHVRMPLEQLLKDLGLGDFDFEREEEFNPVLFSDELRYQPLTKEALLYIESRGFSELQYLPQWVVSPSKNNGVSFIFQNNNKVFGYQTRLFPVFVKKETVRYVLEGQRLPWFGDLWHGKQFGTHVIVFEKAFGTLKAQYAANKYGLPVTAICSAGSNFQHRLLDLVDLNVPFVFDNDVAGRSAADFVTKQGYRALIPKLPIDDTPVDNVARIIEKIIRS